VVPAMRVDTGYEAARAAVATPELAVPKPMASAGGRCQ
jgi:hypothetical protein